MKAIISGIKGIVDFISLIIDLVVSLVRSLINLTTYLSQALVISFDFISTFPDWLKTFALITISISILYIILGRNGGAD